MSTKGLKLTNRNADRKILSYVNSDWAGEVTPRKTTTITQLKCMRMYFFSKLKKETKKIGWKHDRIVSQF